MVDNYTFSFSSIQKTTFLLNRSEMEGRWDPTFYLPEIVELEKKIKEKNPKKLISFVKSISSGATPNKAESEKYYSDKENGIPFIRVQNLSETGQLNLNNIVFINQNTHDGVLSRSKIFEGDLLIKITGVGRMAIASVAPKAFIGNANQHLVVIKTKNNETSEKISAFLNSDIGEKLASRRATGGTRPALDYPALLSIPIIFDERIHEIFIKAIQNKQSSRQGGISPPSLSQNRT